MKQATTRGFTLIEIMVVGAILGVLSTVAVPVYLRATLRARAAERTYMVRTIHSCIEDIYRAGDRFPPDPNANSVTGEWNPPLPYSTQKRVFVPTMVGWNILTGRAGGANGGGALVVEGALYYSYRFVAWEAAAPGATVQANGDLDGDGVPSTKVIVYLRNQGAYVPTAELPPAEQENLDTF